MDESGQVSAELLIVLAALAALALFMVNQLQTSAKGMSETTQKKIEEINKKLSAARRAAEGGAGTAS